ncbi:helix-turn-helix domain-containing protein [Sinanaerobacter chloroacetimidivorans]|jgi:transcriptional regulator with XRE-family HTH domain|uniref:Helix-turn-helix transcriptional regulator n=1 Tax=Sinanaerobacter chloroacetimidivorans TaxID=2818044 RepID=A0A8J7W2F7_9FIRM|nr:helix-turn-helix transcriptional regulator [Sinanaerobacter chloroacetimidivorans]MBR0598035.1 helix-turn-helix transcriptional regulator [Sinanaerobacter chloroacetimidivorans]
MLHERLVVLLKKLGLSQRQFANRINLDPGYFSRIIQGKTMPSKRILLLIENIYNVNMKWLETGEGEIFKNKNMTHKKAEILKIIDTLEKDQVNAVSSFLKYLQEEKNKNE